MSRTGRGGIGMGLAALIVAVSGAAAGAQTLQASLPGSTFPVATAGGARPIQGWTEFCRLHPAECRIDTSEPAVIRLTPQVWRTIVSVNRKVNADIRPLTDEEHWGLPDVWSFPTDGYGDCEDYQLLKRKLLAEAGIPHRAMRMTVVIDEKREGHAVLMIRTDRGDLILDNKIDTVLPWHDTGYVFVKREGHDSSAWVSLGGVTSPVTTANR